MANGLEADGVGTSMTQANDVAPEPERAKPVSELPPADQFDIIKAWWRADADHSREWRVEAREAYAFRAGEQWTPEDRAILDNRNRPHIVFNRVLAILKAVAGMEINGRHEIQFIPRNTEDTAVNELLSAASAWMGDETDGEDEQSDAFDDCCTCGMGWTESRMSYEEDPQGLYVEEAIDPLEMYWDRTATKKNLKGSRRRMRVRRMPFSEAASMFPGKTRSQLDAVWADEALGDYPTRTLEERRRRDSDNSGIRPYDDMAEVTIVHAQWTEKQPYWRVANLQQNSVAELTDEEYRQFNARMKTLMQTVPPDMAWQFEVHAVRMTRLVYKQAFLGGEMLQPASDAPIKNAFSWECVTGERDKSKGTWFGLVRTMRDPQMWANKWLSQILHILNTTAKGGILAEEDAFEDQREAENSYAQADTITWVAPGSLSGQNPKIKEKPGAGKVDAYLGLMSFAISSVKDVIGVNLELLGQQDMQQPGIVEAMRKQAGMTILATLFDTLRRFRKGIGKKRLFFIQNYLSDGRLIRVTKIIGGEQQVQALPLVRDKVLGEYNVIVDDAPASPNQKEANWQIIQPMLVVFKEQLMANPQVLGLLLEYSPLPARIVQAVQQFIAQQAQDPEAQAIKQIAQAKEISEIEKNKSIANMNNAKAGGAQSTAVYEIAMAQNLMHDNAREERRHQIAMLKDFMDARQAELDAADKAAERENRSVVDAHKVVNEQRKTDIAAVDAGTRRISAVTQARKTGHDMHRERIGQFIDHMAAGAGVHRDMAAARKDHAAAARDERTPIERPQPQATGR